MLHDKIYYFERMCDMRAAYRYSCSETEDDARLYNLWVTMKFINK